MSVFKEDVGSCFAQDFEKAAVTEELGPATWYSNDGLTWSLGTIEEGSEPGTVNAGMTGVALVGDVLVAVGFRGTGMNRDAAAWVSEDGQRWRPSTDLAGTLSQPDVQQANGVTDSEAGAVSVGWDGTLFDVDGAVWTSP